MQKTGIYGGSFDPVHNAHIKTAEVFKQKLGLDKVLIMPSNISPHKIGFKSADAIHRYNMCRLAFECKDGFKVSRLEIDCDTVSYTCDTLKRISKMCDDELYLLCGADMFLTLQCWKNPDIIFSLANIVTVPRDDNDFEKLTEHKKLLERLGANIFIIDTPKIDISSTMIRKRISDGVSISDMVPKGVEEYILNNKLYRG